MRTATLISLLALLALLAFAGCKPKPAAKPRKQRNWRGFATVPTDKGNQPYVRVISGQAPGSRAVKPVKNPGPGPLDKARLDVVSFDNVTLGQAALMLTKMIGHNVVASAEAKDHRVSLYLRNVSGREAIEGICRLNKLWYREDPGMVRLLTAEEYSTELVIKRDEQTRLYRLKNASAPALASMIAALMPDQVQYERPEEETSFGHVGTDGDDPLENRETSSRTGGNDYYDNRDRNRNRSVSRQSYGYTRSDIDSSYRRGAAELAEPRKAHVTGAGATERRRGEIGAGELAERTGARMPVAISVFLRNNCIGVRASQESLHREIGSIIQALDTPTRQVLLEVKVLRVALGKGFESFFDVAYNNDKKDPAIGVRQLAGTTLSGQTVSFTYLDDHVDATIRMLQNDNRLHSVATPMLLCANNAPGEFFSGITRMITTNYDFETRYSDDNEAIDIVRPVVEEREIGTKVRIKPAINADGTVTMRFRLEVGTVREKGANISQIRGDEVVELPIDTVDNEKVESIVMARHGQAIVMGGLISENVGRTTRKVPILGDIPLAGIAFRKQVDKTERSETVIVIIPHIIGRAENGAAHSRSVVERNSTHPWVRRGQDNLTDYDRKWKKVKELKR